MRVRDRMQCFADDPKEEIFKFDPRRVPVSYIELAGPLNDDNGSPIYWLRGREDDMRP